MASKTFPTPTAMIPVILSTTLTQEQQVFVTETYRHAYELRLSLNALTPDTDPEIGLSIEEEASYLLSRIDKAYRRVNAGTRSKLSTQSSYEVRGRDMGLALEEGLTRLAYIVITFGGKADAGQAR